MLNGVGAVVCHPVGPQLVPNLAVAEIVAGALDRMDPQYPPSPDPRPETLTVE